LARSSRSNTLSFWNALSCLLNLAELGSVFDFVGRIISLSYGQRATNARTSSTFMSGRLIGQSQLKNVSDRLLVERVGERYDADQEQHGNTESNIVEAGFREKFHDLGTHLLATPLV
jgi:hypothetical protein